MRYSRFFGVLGGALALAGAGLLGGCRSVPVSGRSQLNLVPDSQLAAAVEQEFSQVKANAANDTGKQNTLLRVGQRIVAQARVEDPTLPEFAQWEFVVVKDDTANAFAMPGGKVAFNTGIFPLFSSDDELAVVMSHEVSHVIGKHGNERATQQMLAQGGAVVAELLASNVESTAWQQVIQSGYGYGSQMGLMKYSRTHESEADEIGLRIMARAGYDPRAALTFWKRMAAQSQGGTGLLGQVFSTHPSDATRIADLEKLMPAAVAEYETAKAGR